MTKIAKIATAPEVHFRNAERFAKAENLQDKSHDRVEGEKLSVQSPEIS